MKRWFTLFAVMIVALGSGVLAGCSPEEEGDAAEGDAAAEEASVSTEATTEGS
jgi:outer membrane murein-binding lipoprotein Lpp